MNHIINMIRNLSESTTEPEPEPILWQMIYTLIVMFGMFLFLILDTAGADMIMVGTLTLFMVSGIVTINEGVAGFSNEGILTVMCLFIVAAGVGHTGALDWYMGKLLGRPKKIASSQFRLVIPILFVSAFMNNTPVVALMIPIVQRWAQNIGISNQQLLIPLSYASLLGGTCTLIGTSTNLVVLGLYQVRYPDQPPIGLFDLSIYGIPVAMIGAAYMLLFSPCLLPGSKKQSNDTDDTILLKARLTEWSFAAGRSVKRSGLRDTGGVYLVSVQRAATGNIHRAVGQDFILNIGDILYFTGLIEGFGEFCHEHGLELVTNEDQTEVTKSDVSVDTPVESLVDECHQIGKKSMLKIDADERLRYVHRITG
jgi:di/tricarboxylate transporter